MRYIVALLLALICTPASALEVYNALWVVNARRAELGLPPFQPDPQMQHYAEREVQLRAANGIGGHRKSSLGYSGGEGVGRRSRNSDPRGYRFQACYTQTRRWQRAGAAVCFHNGQVYYQLNLR